MGLVGVHGVGGGIGDVGSHRDERGPGIGLGPFDGSLKHVQIVGGESKTLHVPAVSGKAGIDILSEVQVGVALDGDFIVVVEADESSPTLRWRRWSRSFLKPPPPSKSPSEQIT